MKVWITNKKTKARFLLLSHDGSFRPDIAHQESSSAFDGRLVKWLEENISVEGKRKKTDLEFEVER
jgi:hypothetical protein